MHPRALRRACRKIRRLHDGLAERACAMASRTRRAVTGVSRYLGTERPQRVVHCIDDGRRRTDRAVFTDALDAEQANGDGVSRNSSLTSGIDGAVGAV